MGIKKASILNSIVKGCWIETTDHYISMFKYDSSFPEAKQRIKFLKILEAGTIKSGRLRALIMWYDDKVHYEGFNIDCVKNVITEPDEIALLELDLLNRPNVDYSYPPGWRESIFRIGAYDY